MSIAHFDVIIVGAGLSGIGAAYRLQTECPGKRYTILEGRAEIGGTWDLFRYPGIRSDSDMFTLGYPFRPWKEARAIADGPAILKYIRETAKEFGIERNIRFSHRVSSASWSQANARWLLDVQTDGGTVQYSCNFLFVCGGYYNYQQGNTPVFPGSDRFRGRLVHPQHWPQDLDYDGKRVVVIGSGATAVTLVPAMAERAGHVTMLQRSPSYITSLPAHDRIADLLRRLLPERMAHRAARWKNILLGLGFYQFCRRWPVLGRRLLRRGVVKDLPEGYEVDTHFNPHYQPWDQRLCLVPDGDLFEAIKAGRASIVTDEIESFTERGIRLKSGGELDADIIVSATGLKILAFGGIRLTVDGNAFDPGRAFVYKGVMLSNVPNFAFCLGYTNASWTLRADLSSIFVCRLLNYMDRRGYPACVPLCDPVTLEPRPLLGLTSGYIVRASGELPRQATRKPWFMRQNYVLDMITMKLRKIDDGVLHFATTSGAAEVAVAEAVGRVSTASSDD